MMEMAGSFVLSFKKKLSNLASFVMWGFVVGSVVILSIAKDLITSSSDKTFILLLN